MKNIKYIRPEIENHSLELSSFLCTSIGRKTSVIIIDEYDNMGEEVLNFDSDY